MKYLKLFETHSAYNTYINSQDKILPNVSYCEDSNEVHYNPYASFAFFSKEKKMTTIPYVSGLTSQSFVSITPSSDWYFGFIQSPIDAFQTEGKTNDEIDALFGAYSRTTLAKSQKDLEYGKAYKVITFEKNVYMNDAKLATTNNIDYKIIICIPNNLVRKVGIVLNETQIAGVTAQSITLDETSYNSQNFFGIDNAYLGLVSTTLEGGVEYTIKPYYTTYDNVTIVGDVIKTYTA